MARNVARNVARTVAPNVPKCCPKCGPKCCPKCCPKCGPKCGPNFFVKEIPFAGSTWRTIQRYPRDPFRDKFWDNLGDNLGFDLGDDLGNNLGDNVERYGRYLGDTHVGGSTRLLPKWSSDVLLNFVSKIVLGVCFRTCFTHHLSQKYFGLKFGKRY